MKSLTIYASELPGWAKCERQMYYRKFFPRGQQRPERISAWVGTAVHAALAGEDIPDRPEQIVFDKLSPTWDIALVQAKRIAQAVSEEIHLSYGGLDIRHEEKMGRYSSFRWAPNLYLSGNADLHLTGNLGEDIILDVKTGSRKNQDVWIQLGAYALIQHMTFSGGVQNVEIRKRLGVIYCPRPYPHERCEVTVLERFGSEANDLAIEARKIMDRINALAQRDINSVVSPGVHCGWCDHPTCTFK